MASFVQGAPLPTVCEIQDLSSHLGHLLEEPMADGVLLS
jgi:hypothetical protein